MDRYFELKSGIWDIPSLKLITAKETLRFLKKYWKNMVELAEKEGGRLIFLEGGV